MVGVRLREPRALHLLGRLGDGQRLVAVHLSQSVVERVGRVRGVLELVGRAPALRRPLLEEPDRVAVAVLEVAQVRLLVRRGEGDRGGPGRHPALHGDGRDQGGVPGLLQVQLDQVAVDLCLALLDGRDQRRQRAVAPGDERRRAAEDEGGDDEDRQQAPGHAGTRPQLACRAALSSIRPAFHGTASIAPVTELRRNRTWSEPESSTAFTTVPSGRVTLVPAVT